MKQSSSQARWSSAVAAGGARDPLDVPDLGDVEIAMLRATSSGGEPLGVIAGDQLASGGKRLRARLGLAAARSLGVSSDDAIVWAAAVELLHNATLIHDDVQDRDRMRRGRPAVWVSHGVAQAINAGNFMLMLPYAVLAEIGGAVARIELCDALATTAVRVVRGQAAELDLPVQRRLDRASYTAAAAGKTGAMFALPVVGAAILGGRSRAQAERLGAPFVELGVAFQILDDVLDARGHKGREGPGRDVHEGKIGALVVEHLARRPADQEWLMEILSAPPDATPPAAVARVLESYRASGAIAGAVEWLQVTAARALAAPALAEEPALRALATSLAARCGALPLPALEGVA